MASLIYNSFKEKIMDGSIDLDTDTIKVMLVTSSYTASQDDHEDYNDVKAYEVSGTNYTAGGATLSVTISKDNTDNEGVMDATDITWATSTISNARAAIVYKDSGNDATSWLIRYIDFGQNYSSAAGDFKITWNSEGIINIG
jgi:lipopolysaccharide export LptBFGC system permease protein LptF